ncbi:MAG: amino acid--tRNA ligase-related protein [bacterium]|nr:amino acid--tRNA ligase-related protein [bacterium]
MHTYIGEPNVPAWSKTAHALRTFFLDRGFVEVHTQDRLSILAACEDPTTVATFTYAGEQWPLPQTGQMWLEYELLNRPEVPGVFCISTSFRQEPNPVPGRHKILFPMFEFESRGTIDDLRILESELLEALGYGLRDQFPHVPYDEAAQKFAVDELSSEHEGKLCHSLGRAVFLEYFPEHTSPFWNMKRSGDGHAHKIDVLIDGMETIGSAERSSDPHAMREAFYTISEGKYAERLFSLFGRSRVERELEDFLALPFVPRYGGGIGMTRLIRSLYPIAVAA